MAKSNLIEKTGAKLRATDAFAAAVAKEFNAGAKLPEIIKTLDSATGAKTIHLVSPIVWKLDGSARPFPAATVANAAKLRAAVVAARKSGERREVVAARAGISVAKVAELETKGKNAAPIYTGRGTKKHLATAGA